MCKQLFFSSLLIVTVLAGGHTYYWGAFIYIFFFFFQTFCVIWVLFENRPALYFCNYYIFITAHKLYNFGFRIPYQRYCLIFFIANNNNYDSNNESIAP